MNYSIIEAAKAIIPHLPALLGKQAEPMSQRLRTVFDKQVDEAQIEIEIIDLLSEHEATRAWMNAQLQGEKETTKGGTLVFNELGGNSDNVQGATYYKCPECDYRWTKTLDWQTPTRCPTHDCDLIEDN